MKNNSKKMSLSSIFSIMITLIQAKDVSIEKEKEKKVER